MVCRTDVCCPNPAWTGPSPQDSFNANDQHGGFHQWGPVAIWILDGYWKIPWKILENPMKQIPLQVDDDWGSPHAFAFTVVSPNFHLQRLLMVTVSRIYGSSDVVAGSLVQPVPTVLQARFRAWSMMVNVSLWWYHDDIPNSWVMSRTFSSGFTNPCFAFLHVEPPRTMIDPRSPWGMDFGLMFHDSAVTSVTSNIFQLSLANSCCEIWVWHGLTVWLKSRLPHHPHPIKWSINRLSHVDHFPSRIAMNNGAQ